MAYTHAWVATVSGAQPADQIDDIISAKLLDIEERLEGALVQDMATDPVLPLDSILGKKTGKKMLIPFTAFVIEPSELNAFQYNSHFLTINATAGAATAPVVLPAGIRIKRIKWLLSSDDGTTVTMKLQSAGFAVGVVTPTDENTQTKSTSGQEIVDSGAIDLAVDGTRYYWLTIDKPSGVPAFSIYAVEITYDTPDGRSTL